MCEASALCPTKLIHVNLKAECVDMQVNPASDRSHCLAASTGRTGLRDRFLLSVFYALACCCSWGNSPYPAPLTACSQKSQEHIPRPEGLARFLAAFRLKTRRVNDSRVPSHQRIILAGMLKNFGRRKMLLAGRPHKKHSAEQRCPFVNCSRFWIMSATQMFLEISIQQTHFLEPAVVTHGPAGRSAGSCPRSCPSIPLVFIFSLGWFNASRIRLSGTLALSLLANRLRNPLRHHRVNGLGSCNHILLTLNDLE